MLAISLQKEQISSVKLQYLHKRSFQPVKVSLPSNNIVYHYHVPII
ncbi:hypothetical protein BACSTE_00031 [Bacteroides stercoris ATCC 43183]|uniref:Uncharacterized protein n=1 Tax=Bacteroides stercoris ATCC 43183 TaxID=449673 RepID=B0NKR2_BACSE|nr:hypothetical protein BACSTE_00031 [Bacteroides stercoris ATCC 43183]